MQICVIGPAYPLRGGIAHYNTQLALELAARHEVTLISYSRQYPALLFPGQTQFDPAPEGPPLQIEPLIDSINPKSWFQAARRIAGLSPSILVIHWWNPFFGPCLGAIARLVKRRSRVTTIFICHNIIPHESFPGMRALTRFAINAGDRFLLHSEADRDALRRLLPEPGTLVLPQPPGRGFGNHLSQEEARARLGLDGHVLLFFGLIRHYKGLPSLIEALPRVLRRLDCTLLVVGEFYEGKQRCLELIESLGLASKIRLADRFVPDDEVSQYFCAADLVVLPYESATQSGVVPIAYAFGRPVVATRVGGLSEAVIEGETGYLVDPGDPEGLANAILRFFAEDKALVFTETIRRLHSSRSWGDLTAAIESFAP